MRGAIAGVLMVAAAGCSDDLDVKNGRPRVTWAAVEAVGAERAELIVWLQDPEGDAVDLAITWAAGGDGGEVVLAPGSAPRLGLPTQLGLDDPNGQPHRLDWDLAGVPAGVVTLEMRVDDRPHQGDDGDSYRVEGLDPRVGGGPVVAVRTTAAR